MITYSGYRLYKVTVSQQFEVIKKNVNSPNLEQKEVANYLATHYDYGKILTARVDNDPILAQATLPLKDYIYEEISVFLTSH